MLGIFFTLVTNHINLKYFFNQLDLNSKQARWITFLSEFEFDINT